MRALLVIAVVLSACLGAPPPAALAPSNAVTAIPTSAAAPDPSPALPTGAIRFVAAPFKGLATVKVEEHLAVNLVNTDAVITSNGVDGSLTLNADGSLAPDSKIIVDLTRLSSDQSLRDRWLQLFGIETNRFKTATFVPTKAPGLPAPLPANGEWTFSLDGQLTIHGVTKPASWKATAKRVGRELTGSATTLVHWADFGVDKPQAAITQVISVSDDIRLELTFVGTQTD